LNGSGNICSQEFADGVKRLGIEWQQLTGLTKPRQLFKIFDLERSGVITFFELFPTERNKPRDDSGLTTPDFWRSWEGKSKNMEDGLGGPKWQPGSPEEMLEKMWNNVEKNESAAAQHKWISKSFRRMKFMGKSDARCREMIALHLPRGTGVEDLHGVRTFSRQEVKNCKRAYADAVAEPTRAITKAIEDLRDHRHTIQHSRHNLWVVAMERHAHEMKLQELKKGLGGLHLHHEESDEAHEPEPSESSHQPPGQEQASFKELSRRTGMQVDRIEDVFRIWMRHADKTETILKKQFHRLLEELCPARTIAESDVAAWWDQIQNKSFAECLKVDWTAADDQYSRWNKASFDDEIHEQIMLARRSPASFDNFIAWWTTAELRNV